MHKGYKENELGQKENEESFLETTGFEVSKDSAS